MKTRILSQTLGLIAVGLIQFELVAQQETQFANVIHNPYLFNPAAGGMTDLLQVDLGYRNQWLAATGNPQSIYLSGHSQLRIGNSGNGWAEFNNRGESLFEDPKRSVGALKHIVGGKFISDGIGPFQKTAITGSYGVHLPLTKKFNIGLALGAGWGNFRIDPNKTSLIDANDATFQQFAGQVSSQNVLDVQSGLVIYNDRFYFGISGTQLLNNQISVQTVETGNTLNRHLFIISSYRFPISEELELEPFIHIKGVKNSPVSVDLGSRVRYNRFAFAGLQYRTGNSFVLSMGVNVMRNFNVSYAFEYGTKKVRVSNAGTHEIQLGFLLGNNRNMQKELKE